MQSFGTLSWAAQEDPSEPLAVYQVDFSKDNTWQWKTSDGFYLQRRINPAGVMIDNTANGFAVNVTFSPLTVQIPALVSSPVEFPAGVDYVKVTPVLPQTAGLVGVTFYLVQPSESTTAPQSPAAESTPAFEGAHFSQLWQPAVATGVAINQQGDNANGMIIKRAELSSNGKGTGNAAIFVQNGPPLVNPGSINTNLLATRILTIQANDAAGGNAPGRTTQFPYPLRIPPAWTVSVLIDTGGIFSYCMSWDFL